MRVLIDISGIGGTTYEWASPEVRQEINPLSLPFQNRKWNDIWAYGWLVAKMAASRGTTHLMNDIVAATTRSDPMTRPELFTVIYMLLKQYPEDQQAGRS